MLGRKDIRNNGLNKCSIVTSVLLLILSSLPPLPMPPFPPNHPSIHLSILPLLPTLPLQPFSPNNIHSTHLPPPPLPPFPPLKLPLATILPAPPTTLSPHLYYTYLPPLLLYAFFSFLTTKTRIFLNVSLATQITPNIALQNGE